MHGFAIGGIMANIIRSLSLLLCSIIPKGLQDFVGMIFELAWEFIKFIASVVVSLILACVILAMALGFVYSIFAAPLVAIAICAVVVTLRVVFR